MCTQTYSPLILHETCEVIQRFDVRDQMLADRQLELVGPVDAESVTNIVRCLLHLQKRDPKAPVTLFVNSPGGEVQSGLALYDVMRAITCPVRAACLGTAASMAALLFMCGSQRDMLSHSRIMIHDPLVNNIGGSALSVKALADDLMRARDTTAAVIAKHTGMTLDQVFQHTAQDTYFDAHAAVEAGLADRVITAL